MCTDVCTRFGLDAMARGQSRPVQTARMRRSTQDKQVRLKMTWKQSASQKRWAEFLVNSVSVYSLQACFGVWSPDRRDTLSLPRPTCWFFSAFLKWFGQPFISVVSHMRSVLNCWSKRILGDRWPKTENSVINLMSFQMFFIEYKRRDLEKCAGRSFPCKYNEWGLQRASRKGFKL